MIIVLETSGKGQDVDNVRVKLFENRVDAEKYCVEKTDDPMEEKYWRFAQIIEEGREYEMARYHNYAE
jgi:hypothetical protein